MSFFRRALLAVAFMLATAATAAVEVAGVSFEDTSSDGGTPLALNGAGLRTRFFIKVYAMALYLPSAGQSADQILGADGPKRVQIVTLRELGAQQFADALVEGITKNHDQQAFAALKSRVDTLRATMLALGEVPKGTRVLLDYRPADGTRLVIDGKPRGDALGGSDFFAALLRVWLGEHPVDDDLKRALLNQGR